jgi:leucyl aminopeptidase
MIDIEISKKRLDEVDSECEIVLVLDKNLDHKWVRDKEELQKLGFEGEEKQTALISSTNRVYVGVGEFDREKIRIAISNGLKTLSNTTYKSAKIGSYVLNCPPIFTKAIVEGALLGSYKFDYYKSKKDESSLKKLTISLEEYSDKELNYDPALNALNEAKAICEATNFAKDIVNLAPDDMTPDKLAQKAVEIADEFENIEAFIGDEEFLKEQNMGAFLAVSRASAHPARFIHLSYKPKDAKKSFVFVGKGLTYDSGGLSLKPSEHMVSMKADKSGAAAALGIIKGAASLNLPFEIHTVIGACENMIGGDAYKPDDVLVAKNGVSIEVRNTDAEGRLVLADCLCYASELKPDFLVDLATLTGACVVALGEYTVGVMGHSSSIKHEMIDAAKKGGELASSLPFNDYLKELLKSNIADISNISSSRYGGAITAGLFLDRFVSDDLKEKWLHLDIAGPAYIEKDWGYNQAGASGAGVRMALYWLKDHQYKLNNYHKKEK